MIKDPSPLFRARSKPNLRANIIGTLFKEAHFSEADLRRTLRWIYEARNQNQTFSIEDLGWSLYKVHAAA